MSKQAQLNKQSLIQDQANSYSIMGNLFSSLECYAKRYSNYPFQYKFQYYNNFDSGTDKTKEELLNQIITQIEIFKYSYLLYIKTHDKYDFPDNLNEETIVKYLKEWMEFVDIKDYYQGVIDIIKKRENSISFVNEIKEKGEGNTIDPRFLVNNAPRIMTFSNQVGSNAIEQFKKNQDYRPQIVLGDQKPNNKYNNETKEREKKREQLQKQLDEQFFLFTLNLEKLCILNNISFSPMAYRNDRIEENDKQLEKLIDESYQKLYKDSNSLKQLNGMYIIQSDPNISQNLEKHYKILKNNLQGSNYTNVNVLRPLNIVIEFLSRCNESVSTNSII